MADSFRYDVVIDVNSNTTHARVVRLIGARQRVLELGCATGYMSKVLRDQACQIVAIEIDARAAQRARAFCERVIVGDLDVMDLTQVLDGDCFDVVVAADVLEHLKEPRSLLVSLKGYLRPEGRLIASIPNVAHGSVRLALLGGGFPYGEWGLLDSTHLRFFTRRAVEQLFESTGYRIQSLDRQVKQIEASEVPFDSTAVPADLMRALSQDIEATTYQFILVACPLPEENVV